MGGGVEMMAWNNWSVKAEYLRFGLEKETPKAVAVGGSTMRHFEYTNTGNIVRLGVNYKFDPGSMFGR
jgi:opacity protein-like surface antigen